MEICSKPKYQRKRGICKNNIYMPHTRSRLLMNDHSVIDYTNPVYEMVAKVTGHQEKRFFFVCLNSSK